MAPRSLFSTALVLGFLVGCGSSANGPGEPASASGAGGTAAAGGALTTGGRAGASSGAVGGASSPGAGAGGTSGGFGGSAAGFAGAGAAAGGSGNPNGGSAGNGGSGGRASGGIALLTPTINAFCQAAQTCCNKLNLPTMLTDCSAMFPTRDKVLASIDSGGVTVDAAALAKCLAAYQQAATACNENTVLAACQGVFRGTKAEGTACANGSECNTANGPTTCLFANGNDTPGVCKLTLHGKSGDACVSTCPTTGDCSYETYGPADSTLTWCFEADGLHCDSSAHCASTVALGQPCTGFDSCGTGNVCDTVCKKGATLGQACPTTPCLPELECNENGVCADPPFASASTCSGFGLGPY